MLNFIVNPASGNITMFVNGVSCNIGPDHINYKLITKALQEKDEASLEVLVNPRKILFGVAELLEDGSVMFNGKKLASGAAKGVGNLVSRGLPHEPLLRFIERCAKNERPEAVEELFEFLENKGIPITEDGSFLCYKAVRGDFLDKHSGTFFNGIGCIVKVAREEVDPDRHQECSYGLHVGAYGYVTNFGNGPDDRWLLVKVGPENVVAVPRDYNAQKVRVMEYLVLEELDKHKNSEKKETSVYSNDAREIISESDPVDEWEDWECSDSIDDEDDEEGTCGDETCNTCYPCANCICNPDIEGCLNKNDNEDEKSDDSNLHPAEPPAKPLTRAEINKRTRDLMLIHTRDSAVAWAVDLNIIKTKEQGRELGKEAVCRKLAKHSF